MGLKFVKELVLINEQVVPARRSQDKKPSALQVTFLKKPKQSMNFNKQLTFSYSPK
jgi:hypothetical protein